jgi:hypothetical protein
MLLVSIFLSGLILLTLGLALFQHGTPRFGTWMIVLGLAFGTGFVGACILPCVFLQTLLLGGIHIVRFRWKFGPNTYLTVACLGTVLIYVGYGVTFQVNFTRLRSQYAYESIEDRLPKRPKERVPFGVAENTQFNEMEWEVDRPGRLPYRGHLRSDHLRLLHESAIGAFIESYGFGASRMPGQPITAWSLNYGVGEETRLPQPRPANSANLSAGVPTSLTVPGEPPPDALHRASFLDFVYPEGFGYFKDKHHVAGFRPHQFRRPPQDEGRWKVETIELVGLVVHENPVVYQSSSLPNMELLRMSAVRPLDGFETQGLPVLRKGETLFVRQQGVRLRMLGAFRAMRQCTKCHDCERGTLLGAFSYTLRKE